MNRVIQSYDDGRSEKGAREQLQLIDSIHIAVTICLT